VIANDVTELNTLKGKYGAGTAKIDRSAYAAYTNAISALMQQFKSKGDLDTFLVLQNEQNALKALPIIPTGEVQDNLSSKVPGYRAMVAKISSDRNDQLAVIRRQYIIRLDALMKDLMASDRIDVAKMVKTEKDAVLELARAESEKKGFDQITNSAPAILTEVPAQVPTAPEPAKIPADALTFSGHSYLLVKEPTTWVAAKKACEEMGGHLLILEDDAELSFVMKNLMADPDVYIGASFDGLRWRWLNGKPLDKDRYQLPPRTDVSAGLSGCAYRGSEGRVKGLYNGMDGQHLYICEWDCVAPEGDDASRKIPASGRVQTGITKQVKELIITKATLVGTDSPVDITALLQERVENGKLEIRDLSFLREKYREIYGYRRNNRAFIIQYKYNRGMIKSVRIKYGDPIIINE